MSGVTLVLVAASLLLAVGVLAVVAWFIYTSYLDRVERRLAARKGLYRELVAELSTRDQALLEPTIHQMRTLYDLDALEAVLEEQARVATGRQTWLVEVYDRLGLVDKYIGKLRTARKWRDRAFAAELLGRVGSAKAVPALLETVQATQTEDADVREIALRALARIGDPRAVEPLVKALATAEAWLTPRIADILARHGAAVVDPLMTLLDQSNRHVSRAWAANVLGEVRAERAFPVLVRALGDADDEVRGKAATALGRLGDRRAVGPLLEHLLTDPAPFVRVRIACTLGQFGGPEVVDRLVGALGDPAWWVRMRSIEALEQIGGIAEGPLLLALDDPDPEIRERAAVALERIGVPTRLVGMIEENDQAEEASRTLVRFATAGARELLAALLKHPSAQIRELAAGAIRQSGRRDLAGELTQVASGDPDPGLRAQALEALRVLRLGQAVPAAASAVLDADPRVRTAAVYLLGELGGGNAVEALSTRTGDPEPEVRAAVARTIGAVDPRAAHPDLKRLLSDPRPEVRAAAADGAAETGLRPLIPDLVRLLEDTEESVRRSAVKALGALGDASVVPDLRRSFEDASPELREAIVLAIGRLDSASAAELADHLADQEDVPSRVTLARSVARLRPDRAIEILRPLWRDSEPEVRVAALEALGSCGRFSGPRPQAVIAAVTAALADGDEGVRAAAADVCSRLCLPDVDHAIVSLLQNDPSPRVRERAALAIGLMQIPSGETALLAACRQGEQINVRAAAILAAGVFARESLVTRVFGMPNDQEVRELLRQKLEQDPWFRLLSRKLGRVAGLELRALAASGSGAAGAALGNGMHSVLVAGERIRLITGLGAFQGEQSRGALLQVVRGDPSPEVRTAALSTVGAMLDPDELLAFGSRALGDPNIMVRRAAVELFARVPPERAFGRLLQTVRADDDPAVLAAVGGLAEEHFQVFGEMALALPAHDPRAVLVARISRYIHQPLLWTLVSHLATSRAPDVREAVADLLQHRPDAGAQGLLDALTQDPVVGVRRVAAAAATAARRYDLLEQMTGDPDPSIRREVALSLGRTAPTGDPGLRVLRRLAADPDMPVRAAAYAAQLLQGIPVPLPPGLEPVLAADAVREAGHLPGLRELARTSAAEDRRLAAALALALVQDEVAREVARSDPAPAVRHRVGGAIDLTLPSGGKPA